MRPAFGLQQRLLTQREKLWVLMFKNQNLDGVTQLVECLPSMENKAKPESDPQHHWRRWEDQRSSRSSSVTSKLGSRQGYMRPCLKRKKRRKEKENQISGTSGA